MVFVTAVAFSSREDSLMSASADASAWITAADARAGSKLSSASTVLLILLFLLLCAALAAWWAGYDAQILAILQRIGVQPGAHSEL